MSSARHDEAVALLTASTGDVTLVVYREQLLPGSPTSTSAPTKPPIATKPAVVATAAPVSTAATVRTSAPTVAEQFNVLASVNQRPTTVAVTSLTTVAPATTTQTANDIRTDNAFTAQMPKTVSIGEPYPVEVAAKSLAS